CDLVAIISPTKSESWEDQPKQIPISAAFVLKSRKNSIKKGARCTFTFGLVAAAALLFALSLRSTESPRRSGLALAFQRLHFAQAAKRQSSVQATSGNPFASVSARMDVLLGDTTGNGAVNSSDISQTKSQSGQAA